MDVNTMLTALKVDLGITTPAYNDRLTQYLAMAKASIEREGITLSGSIEDGNLQVMYAAWMWRKRDTGEGMPRMLRYQLNNRLFSEKLGHESPEESE